MSQHKNYIFLRILHGNYFIFHIKIVTTMQLVAKKIQSLVFKAAVDVQLNNILLKILRPCYVFACYFLKKVCDMVLIRHLYGMYKHGKRQKKKKILIFEMQISCRVQAGNVT